MRSEKAAGERAVEILQNHGYPYAQVGIAREPIDATRARVIVACRTRHDRFLRARSTLPATGASTIASSADEWRTRRANCSGGARSNRHSSGSARSACSSRSRSARRTSTLGPLTCPPSSRSKKGRHGSGISVPAMPRASVSVVDARISHLNVFGSAERIDLQGRVSRIERTAEVAFTQTDTWHPALSLSLQARHQEIDERSFFVMSRGGQAAVSWQWTKQLASTVSYAATLERSDVDASLDPLLGLEDGMLSAWSIDLDHRRVDRPTLPRARSRCTSSRPADGCRARSITSASSAMRATIGGRSTGASSLRAACGWDRSTRWAATPISRCSSDFFLADRTRCAAGACTS